MFMFRFAWLFRVVHSCGLPLFDVFVLDPDTPAAQHFFFDESGLQVLACPRCGQPLRVQDVQLLQEA